MFYTFELFLEKDRKSLSKSHHFPPFATYHIKGFNTGENSLEERKKEGNPVSKKSQRATNRMSQE